MEICKTPPERLEEVMALYARAREFMRRTGNPDQWGQDYPGEELIAREIARGQSHLCLDGQEIAAVFSLIEGEDPTYRTICDGAWLNDAPYGTVHRICAAHFAWIGARRASAISASIPIDATGPCRHCCAAAASLTAVAFSWRTARSGWPSKRPCEQKGAAARLYAGRPPCCFLLDRR